MMDDLTDELAEVEEQVEDVTAARAIDSRKFQRARLRLDLLRARALVGISEKLKGDEGPEIDATSAARKLADEHDVDLESVAMSRRVRKSDVREFIEQREGGDED